jgi:hypothetical protein
VVAPSSTSFTRGLESNRTATGILIFSDLTGYTSQRLSGHAARENPLQTNPKASNPTIATAFSSPTSKPPSTPQPTASHL